MCDGLNGGMDKYVIDCPICEEEEIVIDLHVDAEYECCLCGAVFVVEVCLEPFSPTLFDLEPVSTIH